MANFIYSTLHPEIYHGLGKRPPFFEGWYFKLVTAAETQRYAVIPGIILGKDGHAFVQVLDGVSGRSTYHPYPLSEFWASPRQFDIHIGPNHFQLDHIDLDIRSPERMLHGELRFERPLGWPVSLASPGIMGWYAWAPRMECYHGVLGFDHAILGALEIDGAPVDFNGGRGYIEKDWGQSFPSAWVWMQTNHFGAPGVCLTASIAIIPWMGAAFRGFIVGLWHNGCLHRFATYTGAKTTALEIDGDRVIWRVQNRREELLLEARRADGGPLRGPTRQDMGVRVDETLSATVYVLLQQDGHKIFEGLGRYAGLEVNGDLERLKTLA